MTKKYGLHGKLTATDGNKDALASILVKASKLVFTMKGCHVYFISEDKNDPAAVWVTEVWDSKEDHDNSLQVPGVRELITQAMPLLAEKPQKAQELDILGGALR
ncbi:antibiotic biosynthesis monooxygenase [Rufibacter radiotolerans]|uniref:Antibiotic biosynthesis monooxygenase n=1 Tax=Rufibacter radiotolerans TaxID=1379910 RepID=A0A0H4VSF4_9BACT|nr:antibiotic biosynthesis monooxygenase [Rufibacter radiotolerans]AKQ46892.1 antibiotic biosynthesis monooxygenase [Rufibacter radiotolerans]